MKETLEAEEYTPLGAMTQEPSRTKERNCVGIDSYKEYIPPRNEILREHQIRFDFLSVGMIVHVGCKSVPFSSIEEGMKEVAEYVSNPYEARKKWNKIFEANN